MPSNKATQYDISKSILETIRKKSLIKEEKSPKEPIAITNDPKFGTNVLQSQIESFRSGVHYGARFADENSENAEDNPLVYYPNTKNIVFSGSIPSMGNLKFQISLNDSSEAPYIFVDGLALTDSVLDTLRKLAGFTKNFREEWSAAGDMLGTLDGQD